MGLKDQKKKNVGGGQEREKERERALGSTCIIYKGKGLGFCNSIRICRNEFP